MNAGLNLEVTFEEGNIEEVLVTDHQETAGVSDAALETIPNLIKENNSVNIETVSGATLTSLGIIAGVKQAIELAGGNVEDFEQASASESEEDIEKESVQIETENVVVGGGIGGLTTALSLAENGAEVILLEKAPMTGGSMALAAGNFISVESNVAERFEIDDNMEDSLGIWHNRAELGPETSELYPDYEKVEYLLTEISDTLDWLEASGVVWASGKSLGSELAHVSAEGRGAQVGIALTEAVEAAGVDLRLNTKGIELIIEEGAVVGILAESDTENLEISAENVILATGGFSQNPDMVEEYVSQFSEGVMRSAAGHTGDGITMALEAGAALYEEFWIMSSAMLPSNELLEASPDAANLSSGHEGSFNNKAVVNSQGQRYVDENAHYSIVTNALVYQDGPVYVIFDASNEEIVEILEPGIENQSVFKGETFEELASAAGIDQANFVETINNYNSYAENGVDEEFNKNPEQLLAYIEEGPYYAVRYIPAALGTLAGVVTDMDGKVLNESGEAIAGLYAVGEMSNKAFYNQAYLSAASLALYSTMGRLIGENITQ